MKTRSSLVATLLITLIVIFFSLLHSADATNIFKSAFQEVAGVEGDDDDNAPPNDESIATTNNDDDGRANAFKMGLNDAEEAGGEERRKVRIHRKRVYGKSSRVRGVGSFKLKKEDTSSSSYKKLPTDGVLTLKEVHAALKGLRHFANALENYMEASSDANYCVIEGFNCNEQLQLESIQLDSPLGVIDFTKLPTTIRSFSILGGTLLQPPDFLDLPYWIHTLEFVKTKFKSPPPVTMAIPFRHTGLQHLVCTDCGVQAIKGRLPPLLHLDLSGNKHIKIDTKHIPLTLRHLNMSRCLLQGTLEDFGPLPPSLNVLDFSHNRLEGELSPNAAGGSAAEADVAAGPVDFPPYLEKLYLKGNRFSGSLNLELGNLPPALEHLDLSENKLTGTISGLYAFTQLSTLLLNDNGIEHISFWKEDAKDNARGNSNNNKDSNGGAKSDDAVSASGRQNKNKLQSGDQKGGGKGGGASAGGAPQGKAGGAAGGGGAGISTATADDGAAQTPEKTAQEQYRARLTTMLTVLNLNRNRLTGPMDLSQLPPTLQSFLAAENNLSGELDLSKMPANLEVLDVRYNKLSGTPDLTVMHENIRFVLLDHNAFTGRPDLSQLPVDLRKISVSPGNKWTRRIPKGMLVEGETDLPRANVIDYKAIVMKAIDDREDGFNYREDYWKAKGPTPAPEQPPAQQQEEDTRGGGEGAKAQRGKGGAQGADEDAAGDGDDGKPVSKKTSRKQKRGAAKAQEDGVGGGAGADEGAPKARDAREEAGANGIGKQPRGVNVRQGGAHQGALEDDVAVDETQKPRRSLKQKMARSKDVQDEDPAVAAGGGGGGGDGGVGDGGALDGEDAKKALLQKVRRKDGLRGFPGKAEE